MSKKKETKKTPEKSNDENSLTPWQMANRKYLEEHKEHTDHQTGTSEKSEHKEEQKEPTPPKKEELLVEEADLLDYEEIEHKKDGGPYNGSFIDRLPNLKNYRNKVLYKRLSLIISILLIPLLFLIYYVSPLSKLEGVSVSGNEVVSKEEILKDTQLALKQHIWGQYWQRQSYIDHLKKEQPRIKSATIGFSSVNTFDLSVTEYKEIALILTDGKYSPVIEDGTVLDEIVESPTKNLPILEGFTDSTKIKDLAKEYNKLSTELQKAISEIKYTPRNTNQNLIQLNMNDGNQVIVNITNLATQMNFYAQVASEMEENGVIDMEVGIFSYPYSNNSEEAQEDGSEESTEASAQSADQTSTSETGVDEPQISENQGEMNPTNENTTPSSSSLDEN